MVQWSYSPIVLLIALLATPLAAQTPLADFEAANRLYDQAKYAEAAASYQKLIQSGTASAAVYFNLGNALLKSGQIGRAIAVYRTLETATPRDPDLRANLRFAMNQIKGPTIKPGKLSEWLRKLTLNEWTLAAAAGFWVVLLLLTLGQLRPQLRKPLRTYIAVGIILTLLLTLCLGFALSHSSVRKAIVVAAEAQVRQAPLDDTPTLFTVYDGAELDVLDRNNDWLQVSADPRRVGWIRKDQVLSAAPKPAK